MPAQHHVVQREVGGLDEHRPSASTAVREGGGVEAAVQLALQVAIEEGGDPPSSVTGRRLVVLGR